jgi:hypothetical protein
MHRTVLLEPRDIHVTGCLRCGMVTCALCVGDEGRYTGTPAHAFWTVPTSEPVVEWLGLWPRVQVRSAEVRWPMSHALVRRDFFYYPANARCLDVPELEQLEADLIHEQKGKSAAQRLKALDCPRTAAPAGLPEALRGFVDVWNTLQLGPESDLARLIGMAQLLSPASHLAVDLLWQRPDAFEIMVGALRSPDEVWQSAGHAMARASCLRGPRLTEVIIEILTGLSLDPLPDVPGRVVSCHRFEALLVLLAEMKFATPEVFAALEQLHGRVLRRDLWLAQCLRIVLRELKGEPRLAEPQCNQMN